MVGRLIQQQQIVVLHAHHAKNQPRLLALREHSNLGGLHLAGDAEAAEVRAPFIVVALEGAVVGVVGLEEVEDSLGLVELVHGVLMVPADAQMGVSRDGALAGIQIAGHQLEKSGLAGTVGSDEGDTGVAVDSEIQILVEEVGRQTVVPEADVMEGEDGGRQLGALWEGEGEGALFLNRLGQTRLLHLIEDLLLTLGLLDEVSVGTATGNEGLDVANVLLLLLVLLHLNDLVFGDSLAEGVVVTSVVNQFLLGKPDDVRANTVEEILGVRNDHQTLLVLAEILLQPHASLKIQMVGRLIKQEQSGSGEKGTSKGDAHTPTTTQIASHTLLHFLSKTKTVKQLGGTGLKGGRV
mmetsp:Transcript_10805/g.19707  ORF Transcript_10805/g.19707 Transcript_10805/m.19707 type:complete len:352 (-) Transcript_10805:570-1625(-)